MVTLRKDTIDIARKYGVNLIDSDLLLNVADRTNVNVETGEIFDTGCVYTQLKEAYYRATTTIDRNALKLAVNCVALSVDYEFEIDHPVIGSRT